MARVLALCGFTAGAVAAPVWHPVECVPADLPAQALYDVAQLVDDFEAQPLVWTAATGGQHASARLQRDTAERHAGGASLRVDYEFIGKKDYEYVQLNGPADLEQRGMGFGFWIRHDGTPFTLRLRFTDTSGECHQIDLLASARPGWQFVAGELDSQSTAWGGDGNGRKDYPCKLAGIVIDRPQVGFVGKGRLWIDDTAIVRPVRSATRPLTVQVQDPPFGNLYAVGDTVALRVSGDGERVRWTTTDFFGRELGKGEGEATSTEARFDLRQSGWFSCKMELLADGRVVGTQHFPCAALPGGSEPARSDFVGVCSHYGQKAYPLETMELMRRYGIDQFRDEIHWRAYEREKGRLALPDYAATYLKRAAALGLRPLIIYDYNNPHYDNDGFPNSPEAIRAFAAYAVDLTRQTRGLVNMFEVWNEWVGGCGMGGRSGTHDGEAYGRLLQPVYAAVKQAFPDVTIVGIGGEYGPNCAGHILDALRTAGPEAMDAWSIHPYRYPRPPESSDLVGEVRAIAAKVAGAGAKTRAWITEIGYPTHRTSGGSDLAAQARHCVRTLALLQSMPEVGKVFWYDFKDDGTRRDYNEHNFGVVHHQQYHCAPKPAVVAMSVFIRMTGDATCQGLRQSGDRWAVLYRKPDGQETLLAWASRGTAPLRLSGQIASISDLMGNPMTRTPVLQAGENPVYVAGRNLSLPSQP